MSSLSKFETGHNIPGKSRIIKAVDVPLVLEASDILKRAKILAAGIEAQARSEANTIIQNAQSEASQIIENTKAECNEHVNEIIRAEQSKAEDAASQQIIAITADLQNQLANLDNHLIDLVGKAIEKIIGSIDETDLIERAVTQGLRELKDQHGLTLLVHSSQFDAAQVAISRFHSFVGHEKGPIHRVEIDSDLKPGECFILGAGGLLDISLKTQIENITEGLRVHVQGAG